MADSDEIFLALRAETGELQYKGRARTSDGVIGVYIGPNTFEPEPDEVQAMDGYAVVVDVQYRTRKDAQAEEARLLFELLVDGLSDVPALLSHNVELPVAAYLPERGVQQFEPGTTLDDPDVGTWEPWVVT